MSRVELTVRGMILGALICVVFTAANVAFGLKAGLTFASSIPATVISMAVLRAFRDSTIQENNIVQTVASAAGTLSAIIFVLPGLVMIGWWAGFPFWESFLVCLLGGVLGVMFSIPLRRALVTNSDLPYPEGVACAEVLKVGASKNAGVEAAAEGRAGLMTVAVGALVSAVFYIIVQTRIFASDIVNYFRIGPAATGFDLGMSLALLGRRPPGRAVGGHRHGGRPADHLGGRGADPDRHERGRGPGRGRRAGGLAHQGAVHRRRRHRRRGGLDPVQADGAGDQRPAQRHGGPAHPARRPGRHPAPHRAGHPDRHRRPGQRGLAGADRLAARGVRDQRRAWAPSPCRWCSAA